MDLYDKDASDDLQKRTNKLVQAASSLINNHVITQAHSNGKNIQNKINQINSLIAYQTHRNDEQIKEIIKNRLSQAYLYNDGAHKIDPRNYTPQLFELAIFDLLKDTHGFDLCQREILNGKKEQGIPDYEFFHAGHVHQLECTTTTSSLIDEFYCMLPNYKSYIDVTELLNKKNEDKVRLYGSSSGFDNIFWPAFIEQLFYDLSSDEKDKVNNLMQVEETKLAQKKFTDWVHRMRYAIFNFKNLVPNHIINELKNRNFPNGLDGNEKDDGMMKEYCIERILKCIFDKSEKPWFKHTQKPITIAVSLSLIRNILSVPNVEDFLDYLKKNLTKVIKQKQLDSSIIFNNLYAIIIDTCWYNWFPDITTTRHHASFPTGFSNAYICMYNSNHSLVKQGILIYEKVAFIGHF